jgi:hypothetical protein
LGIVVSQWPHGSRRAVEKTALLTMRIRVRSSS